MYLDLLIYFGLAWLLVFGLLFFSSRKSATLLRKLDSHGNQGPKTQ